MRDTVANYTRFARLYMPRIINMVFAQAVTRVRVCLSKQSLYRLNFFDISKERLSPRLLRLLTSYRSLSISPIKKQGFKINLCMHQLDIQRIISPVLQFVNCKRVI